MLDIGAALLLAQRARYILDKHLLIRCVLTYGANTYTYTKSLIKELTHNEQYFSHRASVLLDDTDKTLHSLDLEGYKAVMSYGLITKAGSEWVATAPLWVASQQRDSYRDRLECILTLEGIFDRMGKQKAISSMALASTDTQTTKTLITALCDTTLTDGTNTPYDGYPVYDIVFDSEDALIDVFIPADGFRVSTNDTRRAKFQELMNYTSCVAILKNDGKIHIKDPTTSGTTYDAEYTLAEGRDNQAFFSKRFRRRVVSPNKIIYSSYPASGDGYTGYASDASADLTDMLEAETHFGRVTSNAQCTALATAYLSKVQMMNETGSCILPFVNFGQELYDYVNVIDARAGDSRAGNLGYINRYYSQRGQRFNMNFGFGRLPLGVAALQGLANEGALTVENILPLIDSLFTYVEQMVDYLGYTITTDDLNQALLDLYDDAYFRKATVTQSLTIPSEAA